MNPVGSVKDRIGKEMIEAAESQGSHFISILSLFVAIYCSSSSLFLLLVHLLGLLQPGMTIYEATAGNTGQALLALSNAKGYRCTFYCPEKVSAEKISGLQTLGAEVGQGE
jgi:cysteine synthase